MRQSKYKDINTQCKETSNKFIKKLSGVNLDYHFSSKIKQSGTVHLIPFDSLAVA